MLSSHACKIINYRVSTQHRSQLFKQLCIHARTSLNFYVHQKLSNSVEKTFLQAVMLICLNQIETLNY